MCVCVYVLDQQADHDQIVIKSNPLYILNDL